MTRGRGSLLVVLSVLPLLAALGLWYGLAQSYRVPTRWRIGTSSPEGSRRRRGSTFGGGC